MIVSFIIGFVIGTWLGFIVLALCSASKGDNDDAIH